MASLNQRKKGTRRPPAPRPREELDDDDDEAFERRGGIKWKYVVFLLLLTGTTLLPVLGYIAGAVGPALGAGFARMGASVGMVKTPRLRLEKFYEKHNPDKVEDIPNVLKKYAGEYPKMIKILETKYHDYGFFLGWERDSDVKTLAAKHATRYFHLLRHYYRRHVPVKVRIAFYRMYLNIDRILRPIILYVRGLVNKLLS